MKVSLSVIRKEMDKCDHTVLEHGSFNLLNPKIKIEILIYWPYTFSIEVVGRIC